MTTTNQRPIQTDAEQSLQKPKDEN